MTKSSRFKSDKPTAKGLGKGPSFNNQVCSFCGWRRKDHRHGEYCYHYSDQDTDYFYADRTFKP